MKTIHEAKILLSKYFGYSSFRPNQEAIIEDILESKDVLGIMPTGGGKSLCFQLPALLLKGTAIVISPLIALMKDQVDALNFNGIPANFYNSSQSTEIQNQVINDLIQEKLKLLYVAPESLNLLLPNITKENISLFAIDEAHCISAWGHDFRPAYQQLGEFKQKFPEIPIAAFTATADKATQDDIINQLNIPHAEKHFASFDRKNLYLEVRPGIKRLNQILKFLNNRRDESGIIYCLSRKSTEKLSQQLLQHGFDAQAYHAGVETETRSKIQEDFVNDRTSIIVATIAFGMGIDKSNVRWVIHYNMPKNIESYYQEIGRSGRDGLPAHTLLFYSYADVIQLRKFIDDSANRDVQVAKLERMQQFAEALNCRRRTLLNYFGEQMVEDCGNCDNCKTPPEFFDGTILAQKVCSAVYRLHQKEPLNMLVDVLRGSRNAQVFDKGYQNIKTFAAASDVPWLDLQQYIIQLVNQGVLEILFHDNGRIILTPLAKKILFEGEKVKLAKLQLKSKTTEPEATLPITEAYGLFEELRELRKKISNEEGVPAYIVFSDASLKDMELKTPITKAEFLEITGVGEVKNEKYGEIFIKAIKEFLEQRKPKIKKKKKLNSTYFKTYDLFEEGFSIDEIAAKRELNIETIYGHLLRLHQEGKPINLEKYISKEEIEKIEKVKHHLGLKEDLLKPIFEHFEEKIPYWKIKIGLYLESKKRPK